MPLNILLAEPGGLLQFQKAFELHFLQAYLFLDFPLECLQALL